VEVLEYYFMIQEDCTDMADGVSAHGSMGLEIACNGALSCIEVTWETSAQTCNECVVSNGTCSF